MCATSREPGRARASCRNVAGVTALPPAGTGLFGGPLAYGPAGVSFHVGPSKSQRLPATSRNTAT
jgi:hypothetical protein